MYEVRQAEVARALDVLRGGAMTAAQFAARMWPDRERTAGRQSQAGHALLRRLGDLGFVERVGDYWLRRRFGAVSADASALATAVGLPDGLPVHPGEGPRDQHAERAAKQLRLERLVRLASAPVETVTHDAALGDIAIVRELDVFFLDDCIVEACAWVVLEGRCLNVYLPCPDDPMIVGLTPVEAARVLYLRWQQSGSPPGAPNEFAWLRGDDGIIAYGWQPQNIERDLWECEIVEPMDVRVHRQRAAAGLA